MDFLYQVRVAVAAGTLVLGVPLSAQAPVSQPKAAVKNSIPRRADGHPDLQGIWNNSTITPFQRPAEFAGKPTVTDQEAAVFEKRSNADFLNERRNSDPAADLRARGVETVFMDRGMEFFRVDGVKRTSFIVDPADGKLPPLTPEAQERVASIRRSEVEGRTVKERPIKERCLLGVDGTTGPPMNPSIYNNNYQIVQTPKEIMILTEMIHDARVVHMDGRSHLPSNVRQWLGDSIGHWEGDTLVVETTNFNNQTSYRGSDQNLKVTERFRRVDRETILYRATVEDPTAFTKPFTIEYPFLAAAGPIYEYACHEGNYALSGVLSGINKPQ